MGDFSILANRLKELRTSLGKTQKEFSKIVGCTAATLSAYENGSKSPSLEIVRNIAQKTDVSIDWLCGLSEIKGINDGFKTCADIVNILFKISQSTNILLGIEECSDCPYLTFNDDMLNDFLREWVDATNILRSSIKSDVAASMYESWKESKLKELSAVNLCKDTD